MRELSVDLTWTKRGPDVTKRGPDVTKRIPKVAEDSYGYISPHAHTENPHSPPNPGADKSIWKGGAGPVLFVINWHTIGHTMQHDQCNHLVFMALCNAVHM